MIQALCDILPWDSDFFGVGAIARVVGEKMDELKAAAVEAWAREKGVACVYFMARADDAATRLVAEGHGFALMEVRVEMERQVVRKSAFGEVLSEGGYVVRGAEAGDLPALEGIARTSFADSRFYWDQHFPRDKCDELYVRWVQESMKGYADVVLVAEHEQQAAAFVTCKVEPSGVGRVVLVGVDARFRGKGLGQAVMRGAMEWFKARGVERVVVATQARNIGSQRLYQRCGFLTCSVGLYYHKWYGGGG